MPPNFDVRRTTFLQGLNALRLALRLRHRRIKGFGAKDNYYYDPSAVHELAPAVLIEARLRILDEQQSGRIPLWA